MADKKILGTASLGINAAGLNNNRRVWTLTTSATDPITSYNNLTQGNYLPFFVDTAYALNAGDLLPLYFHTGTSGVSAPPEATTVILRVYYETGTGLQIVELHNGAAPANGTQYNFYATDDNTATGNPIAGTLRLYIQVISTGTTGGLLNYNANSDQNNPTSTGGNIDGGANFSSITGKLLSKLTVSEFSHLSGYPAGTKHAYGTAADESVTIRAVYSQPPEVRGHEQATLDLLDGAAVQIAGSAQAVSAGGFSDLTVVVNQTNFDAGLKTYGGRFTPSGLAQLQADSEGSALWTEFVTNTTANLLTIDSVSADEIAGTLTFTVTRANPDGASSVDFETADGAGESGEAGAITGETITLNLAYTGAEVKHILPPDFVPGSLTVDMAGARSGSGGPTTVNDRDGGRVEAALAVNPGDTLYLRVGQQGSTGLTTTTGTGGWEGGGDGGGDGFGGGGGASDIRLNGNTLADRVLVAGGAGGGSGNNNNENPNGLDRRGGWALDDENVTPNAVTAAVGGGGGGDGWRGGLGGVSGNTKGEGGTSMAHSAYTSAVTSTPHYQDDDGYITLTYDVYNDFTPTSGTLNFTGAETTKTIVVPIANNSYAEPQRKFPVTLSAPSNATIQAGTGIGTITDDEAPKTFLQDFSGNGRDLTAGASPPDSVNAPAGWLKFGKGRLWTASEGQQLTRVDSSFDLTGDLAGTVVLNVAGWHATANSFMNIIGYFSATNDGVWGLYVRNTLGDQILSWRGSGGSPTGTLNTPTGLVRITWRLVSNQLVVKANGAVDINTTLAARSSQPSSTFFLGNSQGGTASMLNSAILDARVYGPASIPSQSQLDEVVSSAGKCKPVGTEIGWYRLEDT